MSTHVEGRREQARVGDMVAVGSKGVGVIVRVVVIWECGGRECGVWSNTRGQQESSPERQSKKRWAKGKRHTEGGVQRMRPQRSEEKGGTRSNVGRIQDDTTTPQNHNRNAAPNRRRQGRGQMKN